MTRRIVTVVAAVAASVAALAALARWEERHAGRTEVAGMRAVFDAVGGVDSPTLVGYRFGPPICLAYRRDSFNFALQLCFDSSGRLVETVDRRGDEPVYSSVTWKPSLSPIHVDPSTIASVLPHTEG
jgi:hypothetical protein